MFRNILVLLLISFSLPCFGKYAKITLKDNSIILIFDHLETTLFNAGKRFFEPEKFEVLERKELCDRFAEYEELSSIAPTLNFHFSSTGLLHTLLVDPDSEMYSFIKDNRLLPYPPVHESSH